MPIIFEMISWKLCEYDMGFRKFLEKCLTAAKNIKFSSNAVWKLAIVAFLNENLVKIGLTYSLFMPTTCVSYLRKWNKILNLSLAYTNLIYNITILQ